MTERETQEEQKNNGVIRKQVKIVNDIRGKMMILKRCDDCYGPMIGHLEEKCPKVDYIMKNEKYIEEIEGFLAAVWETYRRIREEHIERMIATSTCLRNGVTALPKGGPPEGM